MDPLSQGHQKTNAIKQREGTAETQIDVPHTNTSTTNYIKTPQTQTNNPSNVKGFDAIKKNGMDEWELCSELLKHFADEHMWQWLYLLFVTIYPYSSVYLVWFFAGVVLRTPFHPFSSTFHPLSCFSKAAGASTLASSLTSLDCEGPPVLGPSIAEEGDEEMACAGAFSTMCVISPSVIFIFEQQTNKLIFKLNIVFCNTEIHFLLLEMSINKYNLQDIWTTVQIQI